MHPTQKPSVILVVDETALYTDDIPLSDISPADVLGCAARYLELHDWHQGSLFPDENRVRDWSTIITPAACAYGAIMMAVFGRPAPRDDTAYPASWRLYNRTCLALDDYLTVAFSTGADPDEDGRISEVYGDVWNDVTGRNRGEVIDALNSAAVYYTRTHAPAGGAR